MRTKSIRISFISLFMAMVAAFTMAFVTRANVVNADDDPVPVESVFEFEAGAYVKVGGDGGMRFRLQMDKDTADGIAQGTLIFYVSTAERMASVTTGAAADELFDNDQAWKVVADNDKIYAGEDGYYYSNILLDINTLGATNDAYWTTDFVAAAVIYDGGEYTDFVKSIDRSLQYTASAGMLRGGYYSQVKDIYSWLGSSADYSFIASDEYDYAALRDVALADNSDLYFCLDGVEDADDLIETYDNGTATTYTVTFNSNGGSSVSPIADVAYGTSAATVLSGVSKPTKANTAFVRWENGGEEFLGTTVTGNVTLDAVWAVEGSEYALDYTAWDRNWYNTDMTYIDFGIENAGKTIEFSMQVCGTADPDGVKEVLGLEKSDGSWIGITIPRAKISTTASWSTVTGTWVLDENGKMKTAAADYSGDCEPFTIYIKDVTATKVYSANELSALSVMTTASSYVAYMYAGTPSQGTKLSFNSFRALGGMDNTSGRRGFMLSKAAIKSIIDFGYETLSFKITTSSYNNAAVPGYVMLWISGGAVDWALNDADAIYASGSTVEIDLLQMYDDIVLRGSDAGLGFVLRTDESTDAAGAAYITLSDISVGVYSADDLDALSVMTTASNYVAYMYAGTPSQGTKVSVNKFRALGGMDNSGLSSRRGFMLSKAAIKSIIDLGYQSMSFTITTSSYGGAAVPGYVMLWISGGAVDWALNDADAIYASGSTVMIDLTALYDDIVTKNSDAGLGFVLRTDESTDAAGAAYITLSDISVGTELHTANELSALSIMTTPSNYITQYALGSPVSPAKVSFRSFKAGCGYDTVRPSRGYMLSKAAIKSILDLGFDTLSFKMTTPNAAYIELWISGGAVDYIISTPDLGTAHFASGSTVEIDLAKLYADINVDGRNGLGFFLKTNESTYYTAAADEIILSDISVGVYPASVKALQIMTNASSYVSNWGVGNPVSGTKLSENSFRAGCGMDGSYTARGYMLSKAAIKSIVDLGLETMSFTITASPNGGVSTAGYIGLWISGGAVDYIISTPDLGTAVFASGSTVEIDLVKLYADISASNGLGFILKTDASTNYTAAADYITLSDIVFGGT